MQTNHSLAPDVPCPRETNHIADQMKTPTLSLTPPFHPESFRGSKVRRLPVGTVTVLTVCSPTLPLQILPFSKHFKGFQRKTFVIRDRQSKPVKPSPTESNHTPSPYESPFE
jgi:hypothetical protein